MPFIVSVYGESTKSLHISTTGGVWHKCTFENSYPLANFFEIQGIFDHEHKCVTEIITLFCSSQLIVYTHSGEKC